MTNLKEVYNITEAECVLYHIAHEGRNTETGYVAYYALDKSIRRRGGCMDVLYDLAASFAWDDRLENAYCDLQAQDSNPVA